MKKTFLLPATLLGILVFVAFLAPFMGLPDPTRMNIIARFKPMSPDHPLGTDEYGRDVFTRLLLGARISLLVAFSSALLAVVAGTALGVLGAYYRRAVEFFALRSSDVLLCFPPLLLALMVVTLFGPGATTLIPILAIVYTPGFIRVAYSGALSVRAQNYVEAVRTLGASDRRVMLATILPNIGGPILVQFSLTIAAAVTLESGLSFLGLGVVPPAPSWGLMIASARATMMQAPQLLLWPCLALTVTILIINALCDGLRDAIDPQPLVRRRRSVIERLLPGLLPQRDLVLDVRNLSIAINGHANPIYPVRNVSFGVAAGETVAIVGESGSGKSLTSLAIMGLLPPAVQVAQGAAWLEGKELLRMGGSELRRTRGARISMIFQDPMSSLNPVYTVGEQIGEMIRTHRPVKPAAARVMAIDLLRDVGMPAPEKRVDAYPHELSGGMRQRVMIAMALANEPALLIADEPTTALDVTVQAQVLDLLSEVQKRRGIAILFITHSLPVVAEIADRVVVLYAGEIVEQGPTRDVFGQPKHPYTAALLKSVPSEGDEAPEGIAGTVPSAVTLPAGCVFDPRCRLHQPACETPPSLVVVGAGDHRSRCIRWREL